MKLSMATSGLTPYLKEGADLAAILKAIRECGFRCVDFMISASMLGDDLDVCARKVKDTLDSLGLTATQGHAPMYNPLKPPEGIDCLDLYARTLRFCRLAGIAQVVIHPGARQENTREEFFAENAAFYRSLIPAAEENGVGVLIENIGNYADPYYLWTGKDLRELIDRVDHRLFTACWDVGHAHHFWPEDGNQYDSIVALGDKLTALHVHENCGYFEDPRDHYRIDMHTVPFFSGHGSVSFDAVLQALKDIGYKGAFNFETLFPGKKHHAMFTYQGQTVQKLQMLPLSLWQKWNTALYETGKYMLQTYELFEA